MCWAGVSSKKRLCLFWTCCGSLLFGFIVDFIPMRKVTEFCPHNRGVSIQNLFTCSEICFQIICWLNNMLEMQLKEKATWEQIRSRHTLIILIISISGSWSWNHIPLVSILTIIKEKFPYSSCKESDPHVSANSLPHLTAVMFHLPDNRNLLQIYKQSLFIWAQIVYNQSDHWWLAMPD